MTPQELLAILARGEDSFHQFKRDVTNADGLAAELIAFANRAGGQLFLGVGDDGQVTGLSPQDIGRLNQLLSNAASQHVKPPLNPTSSNIQTEQGLVMVVEVAEGLNKPYVDAQGRIWVKNGADKRQVTAREEMQRMFQQSGLLYGDQVPVRDATVADIDLAAFGQYFERRYQQSLDQAGLPLAQLLENIDLARDGVPNLAGMLLFGKNPQRRLHVCEITAVAFPGTVLYDKRYLDSENIDGPLAEQYRRGMAFIKRNLHHVQGDQGFNSLGQLEVPEEVFVELLVNALVHRDFFVSATIRLFVFADRVELISPGHLPDSLSAEQIREGRSNRRNKVLAGHAAHILPYRGMGTGIPRALQAWPKIELIDDREGNQFKAVVWRPRNEQVTEQVTEQVGEKPGSRSEQVTAQVTGEVTGQVTPQVGTRPESQPESQPESLAERVIKLLVAGALGKAEISLALGQREVSGQLNKTIRDLLAQHRIEMTRPDTPNSRLQKYRRTLATQAALVQEKIKELKE